MTEPRRGPKLNNCLIQRRNTNAEQCLKEKRVMAFEQVKDFYCFLMETHMMEASSKESDQDLESFTARSRARDTMDNGRRMIRMDMETTTSKMDHPIKAHGKKVS
jgi:hypothetical protein